MATAKVASDHDKPDGLVVVPPSRVDGFLAPLSVDAIHGVGPVTARELRGMGIETAGDLGAADPTVLRERFGERGVALHRRARGDDDRIVEPTGRPKSLSRESAFAEATDDAERVREKVRALADEVATRATDRGATYRTIGVKVVNPPFDVNTRERSLSGPVDDPDLIERVTLDLLSEFAGDRVRKVGVRVSNLTFGGGEQARLDGYEETAGTTVEASEARRRPATGIRGADGSSEGQISLSAFDQDGDDDRDGNGGDGSDSGDRDDDGDDGTGRNGG
jgi:DNA polymerase IV (DinB-like DNA polymerase)